MDVQKCEVSHENQEHTIVFITFDNIYVCLS